MRRIFAAVTLACSLGCTSMHAATPFVQGTASLSREAGVKYLAQLAASEDVEDLFAYVPAQGIWHDIGAYGLADRVYPLDAVLAQLCRQYDKVEVYHYHTYRDGVFSTQGGPQYGIWDREKARALDWEIHGYPSSRDDLVTSIMQAYTICPGKQISFGVVSLLQPKTQTQQTPPFSVIRWAHDTGNFSWPVDAAGVSTTTVDELYLRAQANAEVYEQVIIDGVLSKKHRASILEDASNKTPLIFWVEP